MTMASDDGAAQVHVHFPRRWAIGAVAVLATMIGGTGGGGVATWLLAHGPEAAGAQSAGPLAPRNDHETRLQLLEAGQAHVLSSINDLKSGQERVIQLLLERRP